MSEGQTEASVYQQAENGKTELSLMHFTIKNPRWQPPQESSVFISHLKEKVHHDAQTGPPAQLLLSEAPLCASLLSNDSASAVSPPRYTHATPVSDTHARVQYSYIGETCLPERVLFSVTIPQRVFTHLTFDSFSRCFK